MTTPWASPQRPPAERSWLGMAMLAAIPLLSLILIRLLWSGSSLWFLTVGIILLGAAAVFFLARRPSESEYGRQTLTQETNRAPLILAALGVVFLAMLLLPNFAGGDSDSERATGQQPQSPAAAVSEVSGVSQPPAQQPPAQQQIQPPVQQPPVVEEIQPPPQEASLEGGQTYIVQSGDNLWDIAQRFGTTVDAIVAANELENPEELQVGDELLIPASAEGDTAGEEAQ